MMSDHGAGLMRVTRLSELDTGARRRLLRRSAVPDPEVRRQAATICKMVAEAGDRALKELGERLGGGRPQPRVSPQEVAAALDAVAPEVAEAIANAIEAVREFHSRQRPNDSSCETTKGVRIERLWAPLRRVGAYVPGGEAGYPSTLIMTAVPALVAGVEEVAVATPCGEDGRIDRTLLATAGILGVDEIYAVGGAQAVAALAYGTESVPPVQKVVGPGNAWVTAAKLHVYGDCGIDLPAGPSEVLVLADETADPRLVAIDLLCQAEHGPDSPALLVTTELYLAEQVGAEIEALLPSLPRRGILAAALSQHGRIVVVNNIDEAVAFANDYAAEHVSVLTDRAEQVAARVVNAGSILVGPWSPESAGDYATGANHVLPTGGLACSHSPLSLEDFGSWRQVQTISREGLARIRPTIENLAAAEGLEAHRLAAGMRFAPDRAPNG